jgi:carbonic anhydrase/acetyltransferase-like protein (isoleucine patch superfamily)
VRPARFLVYSHPMIRDFDELRPALHSTAWVDPSALVVGDVHIGAQSSVWPMCVLRGDIHRIVIGIRTNVQDGSVLHVTHDSRFAPGGHSLTVGDEVTVGHKVILHGCTIGDRCLIGMGSIVMDGAVLEPGTMLGAGSLVPPGKHLEGGYLWRGSPARRVRPLTDEETEYFEYSAIQYARLKDRHAG